MKGNRVVPNNHFRKTAKKVKTLFNQATQAIKRRKLRKEKANEMFPCPLKNLKPIIRCPTVRYNRKLRLGRGFTVEECKAAKLNYHYARTIGISVDLRRRNQNEETFDRNVERLQEYVSKLKFFKNKKEAKEAGIQPFTGQIMPIVKKVRNTKVISVDDYEKY